MNEIAAHFLGRRSFLAAMSATGLIVLTSCRTAVDESPDEGASPSPTAGGTLVLTQSTDAQLQVLLAARLGNFPWLMNVFETLTRQDPQTLEPQPLLATDWTMADDGLSIEIQLRDDVTFHTGRPMTSEDVIFTFEQVQDPVNVSQVRFIAEQFSDMTATGEHALRITFASPLGNLFDLFEQTGIVDRETWADVADGSQVVGTGPFRWVEWRPGAQFTLERYEDYRDPDRPYLDRIEYPVITDSTAQLSALRGGRAQFGYGLSTNDAVSFEGDDRWELDTTAGTIYPLGLNVTAAPFDQREVRQAVGYAIDRERILDQIFAGQGTVTNLFWSPGEVGSPQELADRYTYDPDRARQMIEDAGAAGAELPIVVPAIPAMQGIFEITRNNLEEVGLRPTAVSLSEAEFGERQETGDLGPAFHLLHGQVGFSAGTLIRSLPSLREGNPSQFWTPQYEQLRGQLLAASEGDARAAALGQLSEYMLDEAFSHVICQSDTVLVRSASVQGISYTSRGGVLAADAYLAG